MTRLTELLIPTATVATIWFLLVTGIVPVALPTSWWPIIYALPVYFIIMFGCYALATVGYNVYNVKSDDAAAELLKQDIKEARLDLEKKGFQFDF